MMRKVLAAVSAVALVTAACGGPDVEPTGARPESTATLTIAEPEPGAVTDTTLVVRLQLDGARIIEETTTDIQPDEGHIHMSVDGTLVAETFGLEQEITVEPGTRLLQVEFVAGDHAPFNPRVIATTTFTAE